VVDRGHPCESHVDFDCVMLVDRARVFHRTSLRPDNISRFFEIIRAYTVLYRPVVSYLRYCQGVHDRGKQHMLYRSWRAVQDGNRDRRPRAGDFGTVRQYASIVTENGQQASSHTQTSPSHLSLTMLSITPPSCESQSPDPPAQTQSKSHSQAP
jgi:hypothetical protein